MRTPHLLASHVIPVPPVGDDTNPEEIEVTFDLGSPGTCSGRHKHFIFIGDDSMSVWGDGGNDPLSLRWPEARHALRTLSNVCQCKKETASVLHFDPDPADVLAAPVNRDSQDRLLAAMRPGFGGSELGPSLEIAYSLTRKRPWQPATDSTLIVMSDFELLDPDPEAVMRRMGEYPGRVVALVLGGSAPWNYQALGIEAVHLTSKDTPGKLSRAVFTHLITDRLETKKAP